MGHFIRINNDKLYEELLGLANKEDRSATKQLERILREHFGVLVMKGTAPKATIHTLKVDDRPILDQQNDPESDLYSSDIRPNSLLKGVPSPIPRLKQAIETRAVLVPTCKIHGTPLDNRGKCLQKGCKYA